MRTELLSDGPAAATPATVPRSRRGQGGEPAVLRPPPVPSRAPAGAAHLEPPAPTSWPAGRLTFHPLCTHHGARDETSTGSLLCSCVSHDATLLAQADLTAPVLGILMTEGQILCFIIFCFVLLTLYFFFFFVVVLFSPLCFSFLFFLRQDFSVMNSCPVLYFIYLIFATKKRQVFIVQIYLHLVVLGKGQWVIVYPYMLATKWDHVGDETCLSSFLIFSRCGPAGLSRPLMRVTRRENRNLVPGKEKIAMNTSCRSLFAIFYRLLLV